LKAGASDGLLFSTSWALENILGWRGVLLEASPAAYQLLRVHRPDQICIHAAVCEVPQTVHYIDDLPGPGIVEFMPRSVITATHPQLLSGNYTTLASVRCRPLSSTLNQLQIQHINFYSLDVGRWGLTVLHSIDFAKLSFDVLAIKRGGEYSANDSASHKSMVMATISRLDSVGYSYLEQAHDFDWFVRRGFQTSSAPTAS
jgi:hypothetical protein